MATNEEEQQKLEEIRRKAEEEEAQRIEEEVAKQTEAFRKLRKERKRGEEERLRREEEERKRREEAEAQRKEEAKRQAEEEERRRREEEPRRRGTEDEARRRGEERKKAEGEAQRQREQEEQRRRGTEEEARRREEEHKKAEEEARRQKEQEEQRRREEEDRRRRDEEERRRREEEERRKEEDARRRREEEDRRRRDDEDRRRREEEERKRREAEEPRRREEERKKVEEEARRVAEEKQKLEEEKKQLQEERNRAEAEARRKAEEEAKRKREEQERKRLEEEQRRREQEGRQQIAESFKKAEAFLTKKDFTSAFAETRKILASNPMHPEALALNEKIRNAQVAVEVEKAKEAERSAAEEQKRTAEAAAKAAEPKVRPEEKRERFAAPPAKKPFPKGALIGAVVGVLVVGAAIVVFQLSQSLFEEKRSIAIFPFTSQSNTDEERILGTTLAEETAGLLSYSPSSQVMGASSALNMQRVFPNPRFRANKLNFAFTVSGRISATASSITLGIDIIDTLGSKVWTGKLEKPRSHVMELSAELALAISKTFEISIPDEMEDLLIRKGTANDKAYTSYLRGRDMLHRGTYSSVKTALDFFQQAAKQDPNFAEAHAAAAHSVFYIYEAGWSDDAGLLSRAEESAKKALSIRQNLAEARTVMGGVLQLRKKYEEALGELEQAIDLMPSNSEAHRITAIIYTVAGSEGTALEYLNRAYELDPLNVDVLTTLALTHQRFARPKDAMSYFDQALPFISDTSTFLADVAGSTLIASYQYQRAIALYERRVALDPRSFIDQYKLARAYQLAGRESAVWSKAFEKTITVIQQELQERPQNALAVVYLGLAYSRFGRFTEGEANGKKAAQMAPNNFTIRYKLADMYSIQKKKPEAIKELREAIKNRYVLAEIVDQDLFNAKDEPKFLQTITQELP